MTLAASYSRVRTRRVTAFPYAADVPITHTFGPNTLLSFKVWSDEVS